MVKQQYSVLEDDSQRHAPVICAVVAQKTGTFLKKQILLGGEAAS